MSSTTIPDDISVVTVSPCKLFDYTINTLSSSDTTFIEPDDCSLSVKYLNALLAAAQEVNDVEHSSTERTLLAQLRAQHGALRTLQWRSDVCINFLNRQIDDLDADKARLLSDVWTLRGAHATERKRVADLEAELESSRRALSDAPAANQGKGVDLSASAAVLEAERLDVQARVRDLSAQLCALQAKHHGLFETHAAAMAEARAQKESLVADVARLSANLGTTTAVLTESQERLRAAEERCSELENKFHSLSAGVQEKAAALSTAEERIKTFEQVVEGHQEQRANAASALSELKTRNSSLATQLREQTAAVDAVSARVAELESQLQDQIDTRLTSAEVERQLKEEVRVQQDIAAATDRRAEQLKAALKDHELTTGVALACAEARVAELEKELDAQKRSSAAALVELKSRAEELERVAADKDRVIQHITMQSTAIIKHDAALKHQHSSLQQILQSSRADAAGTQETLQRVSSDLQRTLADKDTLAAQLKSQESLSIQLDEELTTTTNRLNAVIAEKEAAIKTIEAKDMELSTSQDVSVELGCRIADLEEQLVQAYADSERSVGKIVLEVEAERARRNDFQEVAQVTLEAILDEKDKLREARNAIDSQLTRAQTSMRELRVKYDDLAKENLELQLALKTAPGPAELYEAKKLVTRYTEQIAACSACSHRFTSSGGKENVMLPSSILPRQPLSVLAANF